jgi:hypothetical protein
MLVHHFGSKERVLVRAVGEARRRQRAAFEERLRAQPGRPYPTVLAAASRWFSSEEAQPTYDSSESSMPWPASRRRPTRTSPSDRCSTACPSSKRGSSPTAPSPPRPCSTLTLAVIRGLFINLHALEDTDRVDAAHELFTEPLDACLPLDTTRIAGFAAGGGRRSNPAPSEASVGPAGARHASASRGKRGAWRVRSRL